MVESESLWAVCSVFGPKEGQATRGMMNYEKLTCVETKRG